MGSTECRSFCYLFLLKSKVQKSGRCCIYIINAKYGIQPYYALYSTIGDQLDGRIFLLLGCHCIVNMLYYYFCHNIVLVNKLAFLIARYDMRYETCLLPTICDMEVLCSLLNDIL